MVSYLNLSRTQNSPEKGNCLRARPWGYGCCHNGGFLLVLGNRGVSDPSGHQGRVAPLPFLADVSLLTTLHSGHLVLPTPLPLPTPTPSPTPLMSTFYFPLPCPRPHGIGFGLRCQTTSKNLPSLFCCASRCVLSLAQLCRYPNVHPNPLQNPLDACVAVYKTRTDSHHFGKSDPANLQIRGRFLVSRVLISTPPKLRICDCAQCKLRPWMWTDRDLRLAFQIQGPNLPSRGRDPGVRGRL